MIRLTDYSTRAPEGFDKDETKDKLKELVKKIREKQIDLYAEGKRSLLVVFQGMDASGKDGTSRKVFGDCSRLSVRSFAFKKPTEEEFAHDFLWRAHKVTPPKGAIHIFNRSHYEDILIQRVHNWIDDAKRERRMQAINAFEENIMYDNDTSIIKFYMHISPEKQTVKLQERIDIQEDNWKHNPGDAEEATFWHRYMECYEYAINASKVQWHIIPADQKWYRNYKAAEIVLQTLENMQLKRPTL